ncbi:MAG: hypothetical protein ACOXZ0_06980 [Eubacteriales bacterium]|jgi:hypothetical protein
MTYKKMLEQLESYLIDQKRVYIITAKRNDEKSKEIYFKGKVDALSEVQLFIEKLTEEEVRRRMKTLQAAFYITGILFFALSIGILLQFIL